MQPLADSNGRHQSAEIYISTDSTSDTEVLDDEYEWVIRETVQNWLDIHGAKLFALETSKFLATEARKKNLKTNR